MKRKNFLYNMGQNSDVDKNVLKLAEKNDDPDFLLGFTECNIDTEKFKKRKDNNIELDKKDNNSGSSKMNSSSISNTLTSIITPVVAVVAVASSGLIPGLESLNSIEVFSGEQNSMSASIVSIEQNNTNIKYSINLDFETEINEQFSLNDENIDVTLTNSFVNNEQSIKYKDDGPTEQEYVMEQKNDSKLSSKYNIKKTSKETIVENEKTAKHSYTVNGSFGGLNPNMSYTLNIRSKGKTLAKKSFKTKSDEDMLPFEITNSEIKIDAYRDIASFEIIMNIKNWNDTLKFNDQKFVLKVSGDRDSIDYNISTDYSYINKRNIELIYDLAIEQSELNNAKIILRGDISNLSENTNYNLSILGKNNKIDEKSFETSSDLQGLE